ncbi:MAG: hypothetical protein V2A70_03830, partial [Candidatus Omnitrophota bacterium]
MEIFAGIYNRKDESSPGFINHVVRVRGTDSDLIFEDISRDETILGANRAVFIPHSIKDLAILVSDMVVFANGIDQNLDARYIDRNKLVVHDKGHVRQAIPVVNSVEDELISSEYTGSVWVKESNGYGLYKHIDGICQPGHSVDAFVPLYDVKIEKFMYTWSGRKYFVGLPSEVEALKVGFLDKAGSEKILKMFELLFKQHKYAPLLKQIKQNHPDWEKDLHSAYVQKHSGTPETVIRERIDKVKLMASTLIRSEEILKECFSSPLFESVFSGVYKEFLENKREEWELKLKEELSDKLLTLKDIDGQILVKNEELEKVRVRVAGMLAPVERAFEKLKNETIGGLNS